MTNINIRVDETLKQQAEAVLSSIGLNMTTATTLFLKQVVRTNSIPFELRADRHKEYIAQALRDADKKANSTSERLTREQLMEEVRGRIDDV